MEIFSAIISIIAIIIAIISLAFSVHNSFVDRRIRFEQNRREVRIWATEKGIIVTEMIRKLEGFGELNVKLCQIAEDLVALRDKYNELPRLAFGKFLEMSEVLVSDIKAADVVFEKLDESMKRNDIEHANFEADGILRRIHGGTQEGERRIEKLLSLKKKSCENCRRLKSETGRIPDRK